MATVTAKVSPRALVTWNAGEADGITNQFKIALPENNGYVTVTVTKAWYRQIDLSASTAVEIDLNALTGGTGDTSFTKVKAFGVFSLETAGGSGTVVVGEGASNGFTGPLGGTAPTYTIKAGAAWVHVDPTSAGLTVDGSNKTVEFDPGAADHDILVVVAGD